VLNAQQNAAVNGERQRRLIVEALRGAPDGLDTNRLAESLDLHPNTVRWHLGRLAAAGLVRATPGRRNGRGRPSIVHRLTGEGVARGRDEYRLLATMLTDVVAGDELAEARAYETGLHWGLRLSRAEPDASLARLLDREGFEAEQRGDRVEMRRCPFCELAESSPQVICTLHRGIVDGALAQAGSGQTVERLEPFVEPGLCIAHLGRPVPVTDRAARPAP
jgi:predicted ArsR family transcriptional regulator